MDDTLIRCIVAPKFSKLLPQFQPTIEDGVSYALYLLKNHIQPLHVLQIVRSDLHLSLSDSKQALAIAQSQLEHGHE